MHNAGSIGIIGISLILSLSTGVNTYIEDIQKETMTSYPISIEAQSLDLSSVLASGRETRGNAVMEAQHELDGVYSDPSSIEMASSVVTSIQTNNLTRFKEYLDDESSAIHSHIGESGIVYSYDTKFSVYSYDPEGTFINTDGSTLNGSKTATGGVGVMAMMGGSSDSNSNFEEILPGKDGSLVGDAVMDSYDVLYGTWPENFDEIVLVLNQKNEISATTLYQLGMLPVSEYKELMEKISSGEEVSLDSIRWSYEEICQQELYLIPACDTFVENENGLFDDISEDDTKLEQLTEDAVTLKIVGVIRPTEDADYANITSTLAYTSALTDYLIDHTNQSPVVLTQQEEPDRNVLNGAEFSPADDATKLADTKRYLSNLTESEKAELCRDILQQVYGRRPGKCPDAAEHDRQ